MAGDGVGIGSDFGRVFPPGDGTRLSGGTGASWAMSRDIPTGSVPDKLWTACLAGLASTGQVLASLLQLVSTRQIADDLLRHIYLLGATGSGKTSKILSDIFLPWVCGEYTPNLSQKPGALVIETKDRESVDDLLNSLPESEHDRVIVFDPYDMYLNDCFIGLNILEKNYGLKTVKTLVGGETISVFNRQWEGFIGPSSEDIIRNITLANLDQSEQATILEDYRIIKDAEYRARVSGNIDNPVLRDYFANNFPAPEKHQQMFNPPLNKLRAFLTDNLALYILGQKQGINFREAMDTGKILIFCLPKGLIGEPLSRLLASIAISKAQLAAFSRADISKHQRLQKPYLVVCDEFQDYANTSFNTFLEQARSMGISLVLSHQLLKQKGIGEDMIESILGNVGTKYIFACGIKDAAIMARELKIRRPGDSRTEPYNEWALNHLPNFTCIAKRISHGKRAIPARERSPRPPTKGDWANELREVSREKYGVPLAEIEADIKLRLTSPGTETLVGRVMIDDEY